MKLLDPTRFTSLAMPGDRSHDHETGPASDFLRRLYLENAEAYAQARRKGRFCTPMFAFVRAVRLRLPLATEQEAFAIVETALLSWDQSIPDPWQHWFSRSQDPIKEFRDTWRKLRTNTLEMALARATALPLRPKLYDSVKGYVRTLTIAFYLQIERGNESIFLSCHTIGRLLQLDPKTVWRYRNFACELGFLVRTLRSSARGQADEFRFAVEHFNTQTGEQVSPAPQSCVAATATHEIPETACSNTNLIQEVHEESCVASATHESFQKESGDVRLANKLAATDPPKRKPSSQAYIPTAAETEVILQQHRQWMAGQRQLVQPIGIDKS